jgi:hypothetical protein
MQRRIVPVMTGEDCVHDSLNRQRVIDVVTPAELDGPASVEGSDLRRR